MAAEPGSSSPDSHKRKRENVPTNELEIDVTLPEPPSKKTLRKAKKQKKEPSDNIARFSASEAAATSPQRGVLSAGETVGGQVQAKPERSQYSVWIGNLPWTCDSAALRQFFVDNSAGSISAEAITRVHMPAPASVPRNWTQAVKPQNKGFAYVDFATEQALYAARALTETAFAGRNVLIKDAKNFDGRPAEHTVAPKAKHDLNGKDDGGKQASDRVFVGNLGFETSKAELQEHFEMCGEVTNIFMATFQDTGKCKGFAWVTFGDVAAATAAVRGWIHLKEESSDDEGKVDGGEEETPDTVENGRDAVSTSTTPKKSNKTKKRKIFVNRMHGRTLRCEYAESSTERYNKRFRGAARKAEHDDSNIDIPEATDTRVHTPSKGPRTADHERRKVDKSNTTNGVARSSQPVLPPSAGLPVGKGSRIVFDD